MLCLRVTPGCLAPVKGAIRVAGVFFCTGAVKVHVCCVCVCVLRMYSSAICGHVRVVCSLKGTRMQKTTGVRQRDT